MIFRKFESQKNMSFSESCRQNDRIPESHVLSFCKKPANSVTSDFLQLTSDEEVFFLERLLLADSIPVIDVHTWLPTRLFPDFDPNAVENGSFLNISKTPTAVRSQNPAAAPFLLLQPPRIWQKLCVCLPAIPC